MLRKSNNAINSNSSEQKLYINGTPLTQIESNIYEKCIKFLGLHLDDVRSWKSHLA